MCSILPLTTSLNLFHQLTDRLCAANNNQIVIVKFTKSIFSEGILGALVSKPIRNVVYVFDNKRFCLGSEGSECASFDVGSDQKQSNLLPILLARGPIFPDLAPYP